MRIRFIGLLSEAQVAKGLAGYKTIKPAAGIFIKGGLSYTFTFKKGVAVAVTIRRAPQITLLDEPDVEPVVAVDQETKQQHLPEKATGTASWLGEEGMVQVGFKTKEERDHLLELAKKDNYVWYNGDDLTKHSLDDSGTLVFNRSNKRVTFNRYVGDQTISYEEVFK